METEIKWQCIGGWAFLLLGFALFLIVPGTVLFGIYAQSDAWVAEQIVGVIFFSLALTCLLVGSILLIIWCRNTTNAVPNELLKDTEANEESSDGGAQNGKTKSNGAAPSTENKYAKSGSSRSLSSQTSESNGEARYNEGFQCNEAVLA